MPKAKQRAPETGDPPRWQDPGKALQAYYALTVTSCPSSLAIAVLLAGLLFGA
jgi:hypothetical protein